jgi:hypothetical protein
MTRTIKQYGLDWALFALALVGLVAFAASGCASAGFQQNRNLMAQRSDHAMELGRPSLKVTVLVFNDEDFRPWCSLPDAGNETRCEFSWTWLQHGDMLTLGDDGWRGLTPQSARRACGAALWSIGPNLASQRVVDTCATLLLHIRFRDLAPSDVDPVNQ